GDLSAVELLNYYLRRIHLFDETGPGVNSIMELNPDAPAIARHMDAERRRGIIRSPLHAIPILLKDNIDTGDKMQTAAGSLALVGTPALQDSPGAAKLRGAGAVIIGTTTLSAWAYWRGSPATSGGCGRRTRNYCEPDAGSSGSRNFRQSQQGVQRLHPIPGSRWFEGCSHWSDA